MGAFMDLRRGGSAQEVDAELRPSQGAVPVPESLGFTFHGRWANA
ncbi:hypothetical protein [Streptomyces sp. SR-10]